MQQAKVLIIIFPFLHLFSTFHAVSQSPRDSSSCILCLFRVVSFRSLSVTTIDMLALLFPLNPQDPSTEIVATTTKSYCYVLYAFFHKKKRCDASEKTKREKEPTCYIVKANTECKCKIQKKSLWINQKAYLVKDEYLLSNAAGYLLLHFTQGCRKKVR